MKEIKFVKQYGYLSLAQKAAVTLMKNGIFNQDMVRHMADLVPYGATLVPIPSHTGDDSINAWLCHDIEDIRHDVKVVHAVTGISRQSHRLYKLHHKTPMSISDMKIYKSLDYVPQAEPICFIDNVADTGVTIAAAAAALNISDYSAVVYAATNKINQLKNNSNKMAKTKTNQKSKVKTVNNQTVVVCGNCGAEIPIGEHSHFAAGMTIAKDSGLGKVVLPTMGQGTTDVAQLMAAWAQMMTAACADPKVREQFVATMATVTASMSAAPAPTPTPANAAEIDKTVAEMRQGEYIYVKDHYHNPMVFQMFTEFRIQDGTKSFWRKLGTLGHKYMFEQLHHHVEVMLLMHKHGDKEGLKELSHFFNRDVYYFSMLQFFNTVDRWMKRSLKKRRRARKGLKGKYVRTKVFDYFNLTQRGYITQDEWNSIRGTFMDMLNLFKDCKDGDVQAWADMWYALDKYRGQFNFKHIALPAAFKEAYAGWGAYKVLQNIIMYDGIRIREGIARYNGSTYVYDRAVSLRILREIAVEEDSRIYRETGHQLLAVLKEVIDDNHYDYDAKRAAFLASKQK